MLKLCLLKSDWPACQFGQLLDFLFAPLIPTEIGHRSVLFVNLLPMFPSNWLTEAVSVIITTRQITGRVYDVKIHSHISNADYIKLWHCNAGTEFQAC